MQTGAKAILFTLIGLNLCSGLTAEDAAPEPVAAPQQAAPTKADEEAFLAAARHGRIEPLKALLAKGVKPDQPRDHNGNLALALAALEGQLAAVKLLIEHGADPKNDILKYCSYQEDITVASYLIELGAGQKPSELIAHEVPLVFYTEKPAFRKLLIEKTPTDPNLKYGGQTLLINCIKMGMTEVVRLLLQKGADPAVAADNGDTALTVAKRLEPQQPEILKLIEAALAASTQPKSPAVNPSTDGATAHVDANVQP